MPLTRHSPQTHPHHQAAVLIGLHSVYSLFKYYGSANIPPISSWPSIGSEFFASSGRTRLAAFRKMSNALASIAVAIVAAWYARPYVGDWPALLRLLPGQSIGSAFVAVTCAYVHFYTMEVDFKGVLRVRPFGWVALIAAIYSASWLGLVWIGVMRP